MTEKNKSEQGVTIMHHFTGDSVIGIADLKPNNDIQRCINSVSGVANLAPSNNSQRSLNGITELTPQASQQTGQDSFQQLSQNNSSSQDCANNSDTDKSDE
jgi:hypothetical protein